MKKLHLFFFLFVFNPSLAQTGFQSKIDTLLAELRFAREDTVKIKLLAKLGKMYYDNSKFPGAIKYGLQQLSLRQKVSSKRDIANTMGFIGNAYVLNNDYINARTYWLQSVHIREEIDDTTYMLSDVVENIGLTYFNENKFPAARPFYEKALAIGQRRNDKFHQGKAHLFLGRICDRLSEFQPAKAHYEKALDLYTEIGYKFDVAVVLNQYSALYNNRGDYPAALKYGFQSLALSEKLNNKELIVTNLNDLTTILSRSREYDTALSYLFRAQKMHEKNKLFSAFILGNIGVVYIGKGDLSNATSSILQSIKLSEELGLTDNLAVRLNNLGSIYSMQKQYGLALGSFFKSLALGKTLRQDDLIARNFSQLGKTCLAMSADTVRNDWPDSLRKLSRSVLVKRSIDYLEKSIAICQRMGKLDLLQEDYRLLADAQHANEDDKSALNSYNQYVLYRDSVYNLDNERVQNKLLLQYQYNKEAAEKDKKMALINAANKSRQRLLMLGGAAVLLIGFLIFFFMRKIERKQYQLQITSLKQEALNAQMSDHFISNTMDSIDGFIQNNDKEKASEYLNRFSRLIRDVLINAPQKMIPIKDDLAVLRDYIELELLRFLPGSLTYEIAVDKAIDIEQTLIPPMILQILAENAIKHGFKKTGSGGKLLISILKKENEIECRVEDNGAGRSFLLPSGDTEGGSRISIGSSLAEKLVRTVHTFQRKTNYAIIDLLDASNNPAGTAVQFTLPYIIEE